MDLTASIIAVSGAAVPPGHRFDGINIIPSLNGESPLVERELFWRIVRPNLLQKAVRSGQWKLLIDGRHFLLFDLKHDPGERVDLAARHPKLIPKLKRLLVEWEHDVDQRPPSMVPE